MKRTLAMLTVAAAAMLPGCRSWETKEYAKAHPPVHQHRYGANNKDLHFSGVLGVEGKPETNRYVEFYEAPRFSHETGVRPGPWYNVIEVLDEVKDADGNIQLNVQFYVDVNDDFIFDWVAQAHYVPVHQGEFGDLLNSPEGFGVLRDPQAYAQTPLENRVWRKDDPKLLEEKQKEAVAYLNKIKELKAKK